MAGPRMARGEMSGDKRRLSGKPVDKKKTLLRLWRYLGRSRYLLIAAIVLSVTGSALALYGPKLSGTALDDRAGCAAIIRAAQLLKDKE